MIKKLLLIALLFPSCIGIFAQNGKTGAVAWSADPYDRKIFVENNGQCNGIIDRDGVLFSVQMGKSNAYYTNHGVTYRYQEVAPIEKGKDPDQSGPPKITYHLAGAEWVNPNPTVSIESLDKQGYYCTYDVGNNKTVKAWPYKKMIYHNLYPGIDAEYTFHNNKPGETEFGVEYALIVHPGADLSQVKIKYNGVTGHKTSKKGDVIWASTLGEITDHAPVAWYKGEEDKTLQVSYNVKGDVETFSVPDYDKTKTLVIDPWNTSPAFTSYNGAYEMDYDYAGNVYVYGGVGYELVKFNSSGVKQWMFTATTLASTGAYIGGMTTDRKSENTYLSEGWNATGAGARSEKVSTAGVLLGTNLGNSNINEMWRLRWDPCQHYVWGVGNGTCCPYQCAQIDTTMATETIANICAPTVTANGYHDFGSMCVDYAGGYLYTICSQSLAYITVFNNYLVKCPIPGMVPAVYQVPDHYGIAEFSSYTFNGGITNGFSGMACGPTWLYLYQGDTIKQVNKTTGAINAVKKVSTTPYTYGGTDADYCDNVYVGVNGTVQEYSSAFALVTSWAQSGVIYDVKANTTGGLIYACGVGFASANTLTAPTCVHLAACNAILPIELLGFDCEQNNGTIKLKWSTATETNNKYFTIERSADGINFVAVATIQGAGNSSTTIYYNYTDESPLNGTNYYRLSQTDMDGNTTTYNVTSCNITRLTLGNAYPNPSSGSFSVTVDNTVSEIDVYNAIGQKVYSKSLVQNLGNTVNVDISAQPNGIYILKLIQTGSGNVIVRKLTIQPK